MNNYILNTENQLFIENNLNAEITQLILKGSATNSATIQELIEQIEAKKRCQKKLPTWFSTRNIYYPNKLNIEQTSSEITAEYKANLISGGNLIDLTGGFGVDDFYFSKQFGTVTHCEINSRLSEIVKHNFNTLKVENITCFAKDGIEVLNKIDKTFDWIYIDPSRRDDSKNKVFLLRDCLPNVPKYTGLLFKYSKNVMIKTSPLLDITSGITELSNVKTIHIVAVNNEVKELLWILEHDYSGKIEIKTVNIKKEKTADFNFILNEESQSQSILSKPLSYLYEPNVAILKAGAFEILSEKLQIKKLHKHSHLYTSKELIDFPGRRFIIETVIPYNKKQFKLDLKIDKANVTTRNFPETVKQIRKKLSLKDGGDNYLFFTTDLNNKKVIVKTTKV